MERKIGIALFALFAVVLALGSTFAAATSNGNAVVNGNRAPVITGVGGPTSLNLAQAGVWKVSAYDPDGTYLSYSVNWGDGSDPLAVGNNQKNVVSGASFQHTYYNFERQYTITFTVTDEKGASTQSSVTVNVAGVPSNQPPVITGVGGPMSLSVGQAGTWSVSAYDPDGNYLSYSVNWGDEGAYGVSAPSIAQTTSTFQHTYYNAGTYTITFTVKDAQGASAQSTITAKVDEAINTYTCTDTDGGINGYVFGTTYNSTVSKNDSCIGGTSYLLEWYCKGGNVYSTDFRCANGCSNGACLPEVAPANQPPVITGTSGPASLDVNQAGTWSVSAYDPDGNYLSYSVNWGDEGAYGVSAPSIAQTGSTATFQHTYYSAGTYTIKFTVTDDKGAQAQSAITVEVTGATDSNVYASVSAIPQEVSRYDSVYVSGKVTRGTSATSDAANTYQVMLVFSDQPPNAITSTPATQQSVQEITLAPGESKEVSAYFTAQKLGINYAGIAVYQKENGNAEILALDSTKVLVKEGIPNPPNESITIVLQKGWNQISVPAFGLQVSELAQKCDISTNVWYYNAASKQYEKATTLGGAHVGFWVKANADCTYTIDTPYITPAPYAFVLKAGWNMIGSPLAATAISDFAGSCKITSGPWRYSPSVSQYTYSEKLEPGKGYWVKVADDCTLGSTGDMPPAAPAEVMPAQATAPQMTTAKATPTSNPAPAQATAQQATAQQPVAVQQATAPQATVAQPAKYSANGQANSD
ncbi:MAG: PKD domain-containing protein [Candidatus Micrarchaeota archaeon]|nr:PKD domain-containing protein [Candidatus Micrarchaeota archaeon]